MPEMTDLKLPKKTEKELKHGPYPTPADVQDQPRFPDWANLHLDNDDIKQIPFLQEVAAGDMLDAIVKIKVKKIRVSDDEKDGKKIDSIILQVQKIGLYKSDKKEVAAGFQQFLNTKKK